jgi:hypothetical protein
MNVQYANNLQQRAESDQWLEEALSTNVVVFTEPRLRVLPGGKAGRSVRFKLLYEILNTIFQTPSSLHGCRRGQSGYVLGHPSTGREMWHEGL